MEFKDVWRIQKSIYHIKSSQIVLLMIQKNIEIKKNKSNLIFYYIVSFHFILFYWETYPQVPIFYI